MLFELKALSKEYPAPTGRGAVSVLKDLSLSIIQGEILAILGPSGSGKSTLLNIMGTLDLPSGGTLTLAGSNLLALSARELAEVRNRQIGFIFQLHHLLPQCTVLENVLLPALACPHPDRAASEQRAGQLIERAGLSAQIHHRPAQLSGGERQRTAVIRALMNNPRVILADEPTGALDNQTAQRVADMLLDLNREAGMTLVIVTHDRSLAARADKAYELHNGTLRPAGRL